MIDPLRMTTTLDEWKETLAHEDKHRHINHSMTPTSPQVPSSIESVIDNCCPSCCRRRPFAMQLPRRTSFSNSPNNSALLCLCQPSPSSRSTASMFACVSSAASSASTYRANNTRAKSRVSKLSPLYLVPHSPHPYSELAKSVQSGHHPMCSMWMQRCLNACVFEVFLYVQW